MTRNVITTVLCLLCAVALTASDAQAAKRPTGKSASKGKARKGGKKSKGSGQVALFNREKKKEAAKPKTKKAKERARTLAANRAALKGRASVEDIDDEIEILKELLDNCVGADFDFVVDNDTEHHLYPAYSYHALPKIKEALQRELTSKQGSYCQALQQEGQQCYLKGQKSP